MPEGTTFWGLAAKQALLGASAFAVGVLCYRAIFYERRRHRPFLAIGFLGMATVLLLIAERVMRSPLLPVTWRAWTYLVALLCIAVGFLGDALRGRHRESQVRRGD